MTHQSPSTCPENRRSRSCRPSRRAHELQAEDRREELELVADVREATRQPFATCAAPDDDREALLSAATGAPGLLAVNIVLDGRRDLIDAKRFDTLEDGVSGASAFDLTDTFPALAALGVLIDDARIRCRVRLDWGAALQEAGRLAHAQRHSGAPSRSRTAEVAPRRRPGSVRLRSTRGVHGGRPGERADMVAPARAISGRLACHRSRATSSADLYQRSPRRMP